MELNWHSSSSEYIATFAKKRNSLMKKAKDLSQICDAEIGIIIFSCTGQLYEYSSPRQLMGEDLSGLSVKNIQNLENQLEMSLSTIRLQKEHIMTDQINELHHKRNLIHQENIELQEKIFREGSSSSEANQYHVSYGNTGNDVDISIPSPSRRPPCRNRSLTPPVTIEFALRLPQLGDFTTLDEDG
ncbi:hypothetical protein BT93_B0598 [Corymbia citriodora subsp. variegata]|nr:hypothetical protein BT93_B0598 [Corymbia citriodora subsp. variegata]